MNNFEYEIWSQLQDLLDSDINKYGLVDHLKICRMKIDTEFKTIEDLRLIALYLEA